MLALSSVSTPRTVPNLSVYGPDHHFQEQWFGIERCYLILLYPAVGVIRSVWRFKYGNWCFVFAPCYVDPS